MLLLRLYSVVIDFAHQFFNDSIALFNMFDFALFDSFEIMNILKIITCHSPWKWFSFLSFWQWSLSFHFFSLLLERIQIRLMILIEWLFIFYPKFGCCLLGFLNRIWCRFRITWCWWWRGINAFSRFVGYRSLLHLF